MASRLIFERSAEYGHALYRESRSSAQTAGAVFTRATEPAENYHIVDGDLDV